MQPILRLGMRTQVSCTINRATGITLGCVAANHRKCQLLLHCIQKFGNAPAVNQVFQPCLLTVGAVPVLRKDAHHCRRHCDELVRQQQQSAICRKLFVPRDAAQQHAEVHARRNAPAIRYTHRCEANVVRIRQHGNGSAVVKRDVKFARQTEQVA